MGIASGKESELEGAAAALYRFAVWDHFAFRVSYVHGSKKVVDKITTVCKNCAACVNANSNTTNMSAHLQRHHPSETTGSAKRKRRELTG